MFDIIFLLLLVSGFLLGFSYPTGLEPLYFNPLVTISAGVGVIIIYLGLGFILNTYFLKRFSCFPERRGREFHIILRNYRRGILLYRFGSLVVYVVQIYLLHGPLLVYLSLGNLVFITNFLLLLPFLLSYLLGLVPFYKTDCFLRRAQWKLSGYLIFHLRVYFLLTILPLLIMLLLMDTVAYSKYLSEVVFLYPFSEWLIGVGLMLLIFLSAPIFLRIMWGLKPLPATALRERLVNLTRTSDVRVSEILVWPIGPGQIANALAVGFLPSLRYVVFTDVLLTNLTEEETAAVFGHEIGHIKQHHPLFYLMMMLGYIGLAVTGTEVMKVLVGENNSLISGVLFIFIPLYWGFLFGLISRRLEHQADLYGARVTGVETFSRALEKIARLNTISPSQKSIQHPSIEKRLRFLAAGDNFLLRKNVYSYLVMFIFILAISGTGWVMVRQLDDVPRRLEKLHQHQIIQIMEDNSRRFLREEKYSEAVDEVRKLIKQRPDEPLYFIWLGDALSGLKSGKASAAYQQARSLNPRDPIQRMYLEEALKK